MGGTRRPLRSVLVWGCCRKISRYSRAMQTTHFATLLLSATKMIWYLRIELELLVGFLYFFAERVGCCQIKFMLLRHDDDDGGGGELNGFLGWKDVPMYS